MPRIKKQINVRVMNETVGLLDALQTYHGLSQAGLFEMLLRDAARKAGIDTSEPAKPVKRSHKKKKAAA